MNLAFEKGDFHLLQGRFAATMHGYAHEPVGCAKFAASGWKIEVEVDDTVANRAVEGINLGRRGLVAPVCYEIGLMFWTRLRNLGLRYCLTCAQKVRKLPSRNECIA